MYCRKCNNLMNNEEIICSKCGFDNTEEFGCTTDDERPKNTYYERIKAWELYLFMIVVLVISIFISSYIFNDTKLDKAKNNNIDKKTQEKALFDNEFTFHSIKVKYPNDTYGTSTNTIFYKTNNNYKIEFKFLTEKEYIKLNSHYSLDSKLGNIPTKTDDTLNGYTHLFTVNNQYYMLEVSYDNEDTLDGLERQLELTKIINTLEEKKA